MRPPGLGYGPRMTTTPNEPVADPEVVPSGDPTGPSQEPDTDPGPAEDPTTPPPEPDVQPL